MYNGCILRYGIITFFIKTNHRYLKSNTGLQVFLPWMIPTLFQLYSNFIPTLFQLYSNFVPTLFQLFGISELFKITLEPFNYFKSYVSRPRLSDYRCNSAEPCNYFKSYVSRIRLSDYRCNSAEPCKISF